MKQRIAGPLFPLMLASAASLALACGDDEAPKADEAAEVKPDAAEPESEDPVIEDESDEPEAPKAAPAQMHTGIDHYRYWASVPAFLKAPVITGGVVGSAGAIAVMSDGHVGVTADGGANWVFSRQVLGWPMAASGFEGGPWVVSGASGYVAISNDGLEWTTLPRLTSDNLIAVVASDLGIIAAGKKGAVVRYGRDGSAVSGGWFPDKLKPYALATHEGEVLALAGKKVYSSADGDEWSLMDDPPAVGDAKTARTSAGTCYLGKVTKTKKGVVCTVAGMAYGIAPKVALVAGKATSAFTRDGGSTWKVVDLAGKGINAVVGSAGGPYFALGSNGMVLKSTDGADWVDQEWDESEAFLTGLVDGSTIIFGATGGTISYSKDGGKSFEYAEIEVDIDLASITKQGGKYIATDGEWALESADGVTWSDAEAVPEVPERGGECEGLPGVSGRCWLSQTVTTPEELGSVRSFKFDGEAGMAMGEDGLVALTRDGGRSWNAAGGLGLGSVYSFDVAGQKVVATDGRSIAYSTDGGASFHVAAVAAKKPSISFVFLSDEGVALAGGKGVMYWGADDLSTWAPASTKPKDKTRYTRAFDVGDSLFVAGSSGEMFRSTDAKVWEQVAPGFNKPIQAMAGEGDMMFAMTLDERYTRRGSPQNQLLRSDDGGLHWRVVNIPMSAGRISSMEWNEGKLWLDGEFTEDNGATWKHNKDAHWGTELPDLEGKRIRLRRGGGVIISGAEKEDFLRMENIYVGQDLKCDEATGCWMLAGGTLYRPH